MLSLNIDLSLNCLYLLHTALNTSYSINPSPIVTNILMSSFKRNFNPNYSIDQICELILLNTECSESMLGLINVAYECSQDTNYLGEIKNFDSILNSSISLLNRLIVSPSPISLSSSTQTETYLEEKYKQCSHSILYSNLIKSITNPVQTSGSSQFASTKSDLVNKNNQFLLQLNLMISQKNKSILKNENITNISSIDASTKNLSLLSSLNYKTSEINYFHLLIKIALFKSNSILDCLLFSLLKKVSQLTPSLFGTLVGPYDTQLHDLILSKFSDNDGQMITILSEFLCSLIENQSGYFQVLAQLTVEKDEKLNEKFIEGEKSIMKALFNLFKSLKLDSQNSDNYYVTLAGIYSIFYTIWLNKKLDYMNYCKQNNDFWPNLSSTLKLIKKSIQSIQKSNETFNILEFLKSSIDYQDFFNGNQILFSNLSFEMKKDYLKYFGFKTENESETLSDNDFERFNEFIIDANIKSASYAMKIFAIELYDMIRFKKTQTNKLDMAKYFTDILYDNSLIEKWLDFYTFQLKMDLIDETQYVLSTIENEDIFYQQSNMIKSELSIIENIKQDSQNKIVKKKLKSKLLFNSIKTILLLINKLNRLSLNTTIEPNVKINKLRLNLIFNNLVASMSQIINHIFCLNNYLFRIQQEQATITHDYDSTNLNLLSKKPNTNYISLKQSNEIVKQFHSLSNTLFLLITSIKTNKEEKLPFNLKQLLTNLIVLLDRLCSEDFNYFPSIINSIQSCLLYLFTTMGSESVEFLKSSINSTDDGMLKTLVTTLCKIFSKSCSNLESIQDSGSVKFDEDSTVYILKKKKILIKKIIKLKNTLHRF
jgi:hypothetical protein